MKKMIKPADLLLKTATQNLDGIYNWEKQQYEFDAVNFGTFKMTSMGTSSRTFQGVICTDDMNMDNYSD